MIALPRAAHGTRRLGLAAAAAAALLILGASPAVAAVPAGTGLDITAVSVSGPDLTWSGTYSCTGLLAGVLTATAVDTAGHRGSTDEVVSCPATGVPVSGTVSSGLLGLGGNWGSQLTLTVTGSGLLSGQNLQDQVAIVNGALGEVSVDSAAADSSGDLVETGGYSCPVPGTATLTISANQPSTGAAGTATLDLPCPPAGTQGTWQAIITPGANVALEAAGGWSNDEFAGTGFAFSVSNLIVSGGADVKMFNQESDNIQQG